ncbi:conserved hypothetical protein [Vibrio phage 150E35-1]|nr:conserved hypothetical protein [Vibrio phage 150E35-1]
MEIPDEYQPESCQANPISLSPVKFCVGHYSGPDEVGMTAGPYEDLMEAINSIPASPDSYLFRFDEFNFEDRVMVWSDASKKWVKTGECPANFLFVQGLRDNVTGDIRSTSGSALPISEVMNIKFSIDDNLVTRVILPFSVRQPSSSDVRSEYDPKREVWTSPVQ